MRCELTVGLCAVYFAVLLIGSTTAYAQQVKVFDEGCLAKEVWACAQTEVSIPGRPGFNTCPGPYIFVPGAPGQGTCALPPGSVDLLRYCEYKIKAEHNNLALGAPNSCVRTPFQDIMNVELGTTNAIVQLNNRVTTDMRTLLNQFCKTYSKEPAKCDEILPPK